MQQVSFCTTCKGRLWQLAQTLPNNINVTSTDVDIVLLDYFSEDGLQKHIEENYGDYLEEGRLKYFKLVTLLDGFDMAMAKQIVHRLSTGRVIFNLDADNYVNEDLLKELIELQTGVVMMPRYVPGTATSRCGRIGITREDFERVGGYNTHLRGMANDDGELFHQCRRHGLRFKFSKDCSVPIQQTQQDKYYNTVEPTSPLPDVVVVSDHHGTLTRINLKTGEV